MKIRRAQSPPASRRRNAPPPPPVLLDELIMEILSWVPVKPLLQFRCVCKSWKSLISNPNFVKLHLRRSARNPYLTLMWEHISGNLDDDENDDISVVPYSVRRLLENPSSTIADDLCCRLKDKNCYWVVGSCNGLLCLLGYCIGFAFEEYWLCLWNPATRFRSEKLPCFRANRNPQSMFYKFAFGYDNLTDTYKVVAFRLDKEAEEFSEKTQVKVYSFGDHYCRDIQSFPVVPVDVPHPRQNDGEYLSGTLNWLALRNFRADFEWNAITIDQLVIVSLDLGKETYTQLLLPLGLREVPHVEPNIGVLMDCLCFSHDYKRTHFVVWQMKEFGVEKSWTQFVKVSYQDLQIDRLDYDFPLLPLCMSDNGDVLIMAKADERQAILYNRRDNRVKQTEITNHICWNFAKDYVESLVSPC